MKTEQMRQSLAVQFLYQNSSNGNSNNKDSEQNQGAQAKPEKAAVVRQEHKPSPWGGSCREWFPSQVPGRTAVRVSSQAALGGAAAVWPRSQVGMPEAS